MQNASHCTSHEDFPVKQDTYHLYGSGYLRVDTFTENDAIGHWKFAFKTPFSNGLLMLGFDRDQQLQKRKYFFQAVEMVNGKIVYSYNLGHGTKTFSSVKFYDNVMDYRIIKEEDLLKNYLTFTLKVENITSGEEEVLVEDQPYYENIKYPDPVETVAVYFGGVPERKWLRQFNM